ncbi:MAG: hypothetical protein F7C38_00310 [Desulfurococcales archaeon]|nr:hypothetical protein [Desulfurococcales archaeon]
MNTSDLINLIAAIIILASFPGVIWFFRIRKKMIRKQSILIRFLEEKFKPRDKTYWYLGYLVGFRAKYKVKRRDVDYVHLLYTTPPYHVFFYLPLIWMFKKRERLELIYQLGSGSRLRGEAHIANMKIPSIRLSVKADLKDLDSYKKMKLKANGVEYSVFYKGGEALDKAKDLLTVMSEKANVYRVSIDGSRNSILVSFEPSTLESIEHVIDSMRRITGL